MQQYRNGKSLVGRNLINQIPILSLMSSIQKLIITEMNVSFRMIMLAIENMDPHKWGQVFNHWSYARTLYHIIETFEFYIRDNPEGMIFGGELGVKLKGFPENEIHAITGNKDQLFYKKFVRRIESLVNSKLNELNDEQLLKPDSFLEWGFQHRLHKFSYLLRHTMVHLGELSKTLRDLEKDPVKWL